MTKKKTPQILKTDTTLKLAEKWVANMSMPAEDDPIEAQQEARPPRSFGAKDEIFCLFQGSLDNLGSLKQQYGLAKNANEVLLVIEAYKTLRDRAPYPANHVVSYLSGDFAFVVFDKSTSTLFVASVSSF
ncbi:stem-specific protein TSJT1-like isoform X2 [Brassica napus]|uniref:stem-specific protein TSJT1-like isoform X2 n=1 Tax=Brassica napus TaxID=3708 RepID=UPI0006AB1C93|nr:stem-specific protein TSJT1-like isoform X2 [Brassica napus]